MRKFATKTYINPDFWLTFVEFIILLSKADEAICFNNTEEMQNFAYRLFVY